MNTRLQPTPPAIRPDDLAPKMRAALAALLEASNYAQDTQHAIWDFAVEIQALTSLGLTTNDLRWLTCKGYVDHACESTAAGQTQRAFEPIAALAFPTFTERSCFALTPTGIDLARAVSPNEPISLLVDDSALGTAPEWDPERRELRLCGYLVKQYKQPSPNQQAVLNAFQEEGWPVRIDDPVPPDANVDPRRRLHETIKALNRCQKNPLLRFLGDGSGQGVMWVAAKEVIPAQTVGPRRHAA